MTVSEFVKKYEPIINKLSVKYRMTPKHIEEILEHFFGRVKERLHDPRMPSVRIPMLGTFKPSMSKLRKSLYACFNYLSKTKDTIADGKLITRIKHNWPIYRRLQQEVNRVRKCRTANFWQRINPKEYPQSYVDEYEKCLFEKGYIYDEMMPSHKALLNKEYNQRVIDNKKNTLRIKQEKKVRYRRHKELEKKKEKERLENKVIPFWEQ